MDRTAIFSRPEYAVALVLTLSCTLVLFLFFSNMMARSRDIVRDSYLQFLNITIMTEMNKKGLAPSVQQLSNALLAVRESGGNIGVKTGDGCLITAHSGARDTCAFYYQTCDNRRGYLLGTQYESKKKQPNYNEGGHYDNLYEVGKCGTPNASLEIVALPSTKNTPNMGIKNAMAEENS